MGGLRRSGGVSLRATSIRLAIVASLAYLVLWLGSSLVLYTSYLLGSNSALGLLTLGTWVLFLPALGFIGLMIFGMAQQFVPLYSGRALWNPRFALVQVVLAILGVALMLPGPSWEPVGFGLWLVAGVMFVVLLVMTLRSKPLPTKPAGRHPEYVQMDRLGIPMTSAAVLYLIAASVGFLLQSPSNAPLVPLAQDYYYSWLHLYNLGFIALMVFGVGFHLLPRFLDAVPNLRVAKAIIALALPGAAAVAVTMPFLAMPALGSAFTLFAILEATGAVLFALLVLDLWRRSRSRRPASLFNAAAGVWLIVGVTLGSLFGLFPSLAGSEWVVAHGWVNFFGFAGFEIFGVTHEVLPPFTSLGLKVSRRVTRVDFVLANVGLVALVLAFGASASGFSYLFEILSVLGLAVLVIMALLYVPGVVWSLFGIERRRRSK